MQEVTRAKEAVPLNEAVALALIEYDLGKGTIDAKEIEEIAENPGLRRIVALAVNTTEGAAPDILPNVGLEIVANSIDGDASNTFPRVGLALPEKATIDVKDSVGNSLPNITELPKEAATEEARMTLRPNITVPPKETAELAPTSTAGITAFS